MCTCVCVCMWLSSTMRDPSLTLTQFCTLFEDHAVLHSLWKLCMNTSVLTYLLIVCVCVCVCVCVNQLEKFLLFEKNLMMLSMFASHLPHNLCPTHSWSTLTNASVDVSGNSDYFAAANETDGHTSEVNSASVVWVASCHIMSTLASGQTVQGWFMIYWCHCCRHKLTATQFDTKHAHTTLSHIQLQCHISYIISTSLRFFSHP